MADTGDTIRAQIARLAEGESYSRSSRLRLDRLDTAVLSGEIERLRNAMQPHVRRAQQDTGHEYTIEVGTWTTRSLHMVVTCVATCVSRNSERVL